MIPRPTSASAQAQAWMVLAAVSFTALWVLIRLASHSLHPVNLTFWRNAAGLIVLAPLIVRQWSDIWPTANLSGHLRRSASGTLGMLASFYAIANAPLASVMAINYAAPLIATLVAILMLGEPVRVRRMAALAVGFAGVLVVTRPWHLPITPGIASAMAAAVFVAMSMIAIKQLTGTEKLAAVLAYSFLLPLPVLLALAAPFWQWPDGRDLVLIALIGVVAVIAQLALVRAFALVEATAILPLDFLRFALVLLCSVLVFHEPFDGWTVVGGSIILASTIYLAHRERVAASANQPAAQPPLT